jgi:hypothetical protein
MALIHITAVGIKNIEKRVTQRLNFLGGDGMRAIIQDMGKDAVLEVQKYVGRLNPGPVQDLTEKYKKVKQRMVGNVYPILARTLLMVSSMYSRVRRDTRGKWTISIGFSGSQPSGISNARLAQIHANGEGNMPKRDFIILPTGFGWKWQKKISSAVSKAR